MSIWAWSPSLDWYFWMLLPWSSLMFLTIKHNHIHYPIFYNKQANAVFESVLNFFTSGTCGSMILIHLVNHHKETNSENDWGKTTTYQSRFAIVNFLKYALLTPKEMIKNKKKWLDNEPNPSLKNKIQLESRVLLFFYVFLFVIKPLDTLYLIILPNILGQFILISLNYCQHCGCECPSAYNHSRNFTSPVLNFMLFNTGIHTVHHLYPNIHWSEYPRLHKEMEGKIDRQFNEKSLILYLLRLIFRIEKPITNKT